MPTTNDVRTKVSWLVLLATLSACAPMLGLDDEATLATGGAGGAGSATTTSESATSTASSSSSATGGVACGGTLCHADEYCDLGHCKNKKQENNPCVTGEECASAHCEGWKCVP